MRAIWSGALNFGLINIPIKLYSASEERELSFHYLHKADLSPVRFAKVCKQEEKEIPYEDIVKGYEYQAGEYVIMTDDDFKKANVQRTKMIEILDFVDEKEVDSMYFEKPYFLEPDKLAGKPYALLREALKRSKKIGIAKFVLRSKEHLAAVKPQGKVLLLNQMKFQEELRTPEKLSLPGAEKLNPRELEMALRLIDQLTTGFKPEEYKDTYTEELKEIIAEKAKGKRPKARGKEPQPTKVEDLMSMLKASLEKERKRSPATRR
jgi:DNA end-binding protein Ku